MRFVDKSVIVTGAASGFGAAIAEKFAGEGARVLLADLDFAGAQKQADALPGALPLQVDVADPADNRSMIDEAVRQFGGIDVLCCNAGVPHRGSYLTRMEVEDFDRMWAVNVRSIFLAVRAAAAHMPPGASIISTASIGARRPRPGLCAYNAAKAAVVTLTKGMAVELAPDIRVNCVCPVSSPTGFDMHSLGVAELSPEMQAKVVSGIPMGRRARPLDVANAYAFLASDEAGFLTGVALDVDGGRSIQ